MFIRKGKPVGSINYAELKAAKNASRQVKAEAKEHVDDDAAAKATTPAKSATTSHTGHSNSSGSGGQGKAADDKGDAKK